MPKGFEIVSESTIEAQSVGSRPAGDLGGDLASSRGIDIHAVRPNEHASIFRSEVREGAVGFGNYVADNPFHGDSPGKYVGKGAAYQADHIGKAGYYGMAGTMDAAIRQHGNVSGGLNNYEINKSINEGAASAGRTEPVEPLQDGAHYYNEDGVRVTDSRYDPDNMTPERIDEIKNTNDPLYPDENWQPPETNDSAGDDLNAGTNEQPSDNHAEDAHADEGEDLNAGSDEPMNDTQAEDASADDTQAEDAPADDTQAEDAPADDTQAEDAPADDIQAEDAPADDTQAEDAPADDTQAEDAPADDTPAEDAPADDIPAEDAPADDASFDETPVEDSPTDDTHSDDAPTDDAPTDDTPVDETPSDDAPVEDSPTDDSPVNDSPADDSPVDGAPMDDMGGDMGGADMAGADMAG